MTERWIGSEGGSGNPHRRGRLGVLFQQEHIAEPGSDRTDAALLVRLPQIHGVAQRFFDPIVEVVSERRTDLRLELDRGDESALVDDYQVPSLGWPIVAGQLNVSPTAYGCFRESLVEKDLLKELGQGVQMSASRY